MYQSKDDADVVVDVEGALIPVTKARYHPGPRNQVVLSLDRLKLLQLLEKLKHGTDEKRPYREPGQP